MLCPVCTTELVISDRQGIEIDYCPRCRGVWLDRGELDKIIERTNAAIPTQYEPDEPAKAKRGKDYVPPPPRSDYDDRRRYDDDDDDYRRYDDDKRPYDKKRRKKSVLEEIFDIFD